MMQIMKTAAVVLARHYHTNVDSSHASKYTTTWLNHDDKLLLLKVKVKDEHLL